MSFYRKHMFFCTNFKGSGKKCCDNFDAKSMFAYARKRIIELDLGKGENGIKVSTSSCMGRCEKGPCVVVYPDGIWYSYASTVDIEKIITSHLRDEKVVTELLI